MLPILPCLSGKVCQKAAAASKNIPTKKQSPRIKEESMAKHCPHRVHRSWACAKTKMAAAFLWLS